MRKTEQKRKLSEENGL